jgi:hypothetical protein
MATAVAPSCSGTPFVIERPATAMVANDMLAMAVMAWAIRGADTVTA